MTTSRLPLDAGTPSYGCHDVARRSQETNGYGRRKEDRARTLLFVVSLLVIGLLAFGGGYSLGRGDRVTANPTPTAGPSPASPSESPGPSASPGPEDAVLGDGRYFVAASRVLDGPPLALRFDLAYLLTGSAAAQAAADHGEVLESDFYIVNDNPLLRELPVSPLVRVRYIPEAACCDLRDGLFVPWAAAVNETLQTDYAGKDAWWLITVRDGQIVRIEEQYLP